MNKKPGFIDWLLFLVLSFIWGSAFMLMKVGLQHLSAYQVAGVRIFCAGVVLLPVAIKQFKKLPAKQMWIAVLSGLLGSFLPSLFFCISGTRVDSGLVAIISSFGPLFTILIGIVFFQLKTDVAKIVGCIIGFMGLLLLPFAQGQSVSYNHLFFALLALIATFFYATTINIVARYLQEVSAVTVAAISYSFFIIPCIVLLYYSGFFKQLQWNNQFLLSVGASTTLGIINTIATILFYILLKRTGTLFSALVTYGTPFVALMWALLAKENITLWEIVCLVIILLGVYWANRDSTGNKKEI